MEGWRTHWYFGNQNIWHTSTMSSQVWTLQISIVIEIPYKAYNGRLFKAHHQIVNINRPPTTHKYTTLWLIVSLTLLVLWTQHWVVHWWLTMEAYHLTANGISQWQEGLVSRWESGLQRHASTEPPTAYPGPPHCPLSQATCRLFTHPSTYRWGNAQLPNTVTLSSMGHWIT